MTDPNSSEHNQQIDRVFGAIWGPAILDAIGVMTEFMPRKQAQIFMQNLGYIDESGRVISSNLDSFKTEIYKKRKEFRNYDCLAEIIGENLLKGDSRVHWRYDNNEKKYIGLDQSTEHDQNRWRFKPPTGSPTDDTDQAILKFWALYNENGDIANAQILYAKYLASWAQGGKQDFFGRPNFGLGSNTSDVIQHPDFLTNPLKASKETWKRTLEEKNYLPQANGALMSTSAILAYYPNDLKKAQEAASGLAKVTHYDPAVSAHCVAFITMLFLLQKHESEDISDDTYYSFLKESFEAGKNELEKRKQDYAFVFVNTDIHPSKSVDDRADIEKSKQLKLLEGAIFSKKFKSIDDTSGVEFQKWQDLNLGEPPQDRNFLKGETSGHQIGMSCRALNAGFFALKRMKHKIKTEKKDSSTAFSEIAIELISEGGDADTNGAVVGALCGCKIKKSMIPQGLLEGFGAGFNEKNEKVKDKEILGHIEEFVNQNIVINDTNQHQTYTPPPQEQFTYSTQVNRSDLNYWYNPSKAHDSLGDDGIKYTGLVVGGLTGVATVAICSTALGVGIVSTPVIATALGVALVGAGIGYVVAKPIADAITKSQESDKAKS